MFDHVKFGVSDYAASKAFYLQALAAGAFVHGPPGLRPQYRASDYAAFVTGPDGHNIEAVCHVPEA